MVSTSRLFVLLLLCIAVSTIHAKLVFVDPPQASVNPTIGLDPNFTCNAFHENHPDESCTNSYVSGFVGWGKILDPSALPVEGELVWSDPPYPCEHPRNSADLSDKIAVMTDTPPESLACRLCDEIVATSNLYRGVMKTGLPPPRAILIVKLESPTPHFMLDSNNQLDDIPVFFLGFNFTNDITSLGLTMPNFTDGDQIQKQVPRPRLVVSIDGEYFNPDSELEERAKDDRVWNAFRIIFAVSWSLFFGVAAFLTCLLFYNHFSGESQRRRLVNIGLISMLVMLCTAFLKLLRFTVDPFSYRGLISPAGSTFLRDLSIVLSFAVQLMIVLYWLELILGSGGKETVTFVSRLFYPTIGVVLILIITITIIVPVSYNCKDRSGLGPVNSFDLFIVIMQLIIGVASIVAGTWLLVTMTKARKDGLVDVLKVYYKITAVMIGFSACAIVVVVVVALVELGGTNIGSYWFGAHFIYEFVTILMFSLLVWVFSDTVGSVKKIGDDLTTRMKTTRQGTSSLKGSSSMSPTHTLSDKVDSSSGDSSV